MLESRSERGWIPGRPRPSPGLPGMTISSRFKGFAKGSVCLEFEILVIGILLGFGA
jgi:hypothetical protein